MTIATELERIIDAKSAIKAAIKEKGVDVPDDEKIDTYHNYIDQISGGSSWDPENPTLEDLQDALNKGVNVEIGTEIPDTWDDVPNPLIVGTYKTIKKDDQYYRAIGLLRKFAVAIDTRFNVPNVNNDYRGSTVYNFLQVDYLNKCSPALQSVIREVDVTYQINSSEFVEVSGKWNLFSSSEVMGAYNSANEGSPWEYWEQATKLSSPSNSANNGRIIRGTDGTTRYVWLRSKNLSAQNVLYIDIAGTIMNNGNVLGGGFSILPFCFILASKPTNSRGLSLVAHTD